MAYFDEKKLEKFRYSKVSDYEERIFLKICISLDILKNGHKPKGKNQTDKGFSDEI